MILVPSDLIIYISRSTGYRWPEERCNEELANKTLKIEDGNIETDIW
jgi:hypothetical protein